MRYLIIICFLLIGIQADCQIDSTDVIYGGRLIDIGKPTMIYEPDTVDDFYQIFDNRCINDSLFKIDIPAKNEHIYTFIYRNNETGESKSIDVKIINDTIYIDLDCFKEMEWLDSSTTRIKTNIRW